MGWIAAGLALVIVVVWAVSAYNRMVELRNRIANAFAQIDVQLKRRFDLVPNLVEVAKKYLAHEHDTLQAVIAARGQAQTAADVARRDPASAQAIGSLAAADGMLGGALGRLMMVTEAYPELKADQTMRELSEELTSTENRIGFARQAFNDAVLDFNTASQVFPTVIVARMTGFTPAAELQATQSDAERQSVKVQF